MNRREFFAHAGGACGAVLAAGSPRRAAAAEPLRIGIITDEVDVDFEKALEWISSQGLRWIELRNLWGTYVTDLDDARVTRARSLIARHGLEVAMIDSAYLKATMPGTQPIPNEQMVQPFGIYPLSEHEPHLVRALEKARAFGAGQVRIFSYWRTARPGRLFDRIRAQLARAVSIAEGAGVRLVLENEHACNVGTGRELAAMLAAIPSRHFAGLWDPGNAFAAGERPYPDGYRRLDPRRVAHLHLKDCRRGPGGKPEWVPVGSGAIDLRGQLDALVRDRFAGVVSIETHYVPKGGTPAEGSRETLEGLRKLLTRS